MVLLRLLVMVLRRLPLVVQLKSINVLLHPLVVG
jgi:hypothetical protein